MTPENRPDGPHNATIEAIRPQGASKLEGKSVHKLKGHLVLPNGQVVRAQGRVTRQILAEACNAYSEGTYADSKITIDYYTSRGASLGKARTRLSNVVSETNERTLRPIGWQLVRVNDETDHRVVIGYRLINTDPAANETPSFKAQATTYDETPIYEAATDCTKAPDLASKDAQPEKSQNGVSIQQLPLQVAFNLFKALESGKLQALDANAAAYARTSLPPEIRIEDAEGFIRESIKAGLFYWNLNHWDIPKPSKQQTEILDICQTLRIPSSHYPLRHHTKDSVEQQLLTHFNLPYDKLTSSPGLKSPKDTIHS